MSFEGFDELFDPPGSKAKAKEQEVITDAARKSFPKMVHAIERDASRSPENPYPRMREQEALAKRLAKASREVLMNDPVRGEAQRITEAERDDERAQLILKYPTMAGDTAANADADVARNKEYQK